MNPSDFRKGFCIIIPSWNNNDYLFFAINSIKEFSRYDHQIVVHLNQGNNATRDILSKMGCQVTMSPSNLGIAKAVNTAATLCNKDIIMYFNDDMVALPGWDTEFTKFVFENNLEHETWLSSTMIEPRGKRIEMLAPFNYGKHPKEFKKEAILRDLPRLKSMARNRKGTTWPPNLMYKDIWDKIGGFSEEFFPGFGTDPDIAKKMWDIGCRDFIALGNSLVYHFQMITTTRVLNPHTEQQIFEKKHGITIDKFVTEYLHRGGLWCPKNC